MLGLALPPGNPFWLFLDPRFLETNMSKLARESGAGGEGGKPGQGRVHSPRPAMCTYVHALPLRVCVCVCPTLITSSAALPAGEGCDMVPDSFYLLAVQRQ